MDLNTKTTYIKSAKALADKFDKMAARKDDIKEVFELLEKDNPKVLEIGCASGRDALEIIKYTNNYIGVDISEPLIKIAQKKLPKVKFEVADIQDYDFLQGLDIVFSFASLIHIPKDNLKEIFSKIYTSLNKYGLICLSLKYSDDYKKVEKTDEFGTRTYYYYSDKDIIEITPEFKVLKKEIISFRDQQWLEMILQKT